MKHIKTHYASYYFFFSTIQRKVKYVTNNNRLTTMSGLKNIRMKKRKINKKKFDFINYYMKYDYSTLCVNHV